jgi:hypothetical protein
MESACTTCLAGGPLRTRLEGFESTQRPDQETLEANGVDNKFDVAAKFHDQDQCYAINDGSRYVGWQEFPLGHDPVTVEAIAQRSNVKEIVSRWTLSLS